MTASEQARADALADAETLRRFAFERVFLYGTSTAYGGRPRKSWAHPNATRLRRLLAGTQVWRACPAEDGPEAVRACARSAFAAVPALRGEDSK